MVAFLALLAGSLFAGIPAWWAWIPLGLWMLIGAGVNRRSGAAETGGGTGAAAREAVTVAAPVAGRWTALNSPADKVPSHGTRDYGQEYAIDIVVAPGAGSRSGPDWWPPARPAAAFPAFGAPLFAVADATVVRVEDGQRDHLSRTSWLALGYFFLVESVVRSLGGARRVIGNHVVLDLGDGTHALYAHVRRGSAAVRPGDRVRTGQPLGECGNSGNSTEPHLHFQLMNGADPDTADGVPFIWRGIGVPRNGETFTAEEPESTPARP
ncbi:M23 family metallopeptidase [Streptomyces sp. YGL11-2]|uniref:M23 family metallopeptidase n=1 Tax=Streptomyces sp. YGL11-2 TaxID=3414028 RepID=UPI003CEBB7A2